MNPQNKLSSQQNAEEQTQSLGEHELEKKPLEFATPEEMLRHDAIHTPLPPAIENRLRDSLAQLPRARPWWRRWLGA